MKILSISLLFIFVSNCFSQETLNYQTPFKEEITDEDLDDARYNFKSGLFDEGYLSSKTSRLTMSFHGLFDLRSFLDFKGFEVIYAKKSSFSWFEFLVSKSKANYGVITEFNELTGSKPSDIDEESESLFSLGPGVSYQSSMIQNFVSNPKIFESTTVYLLYHLLNEQYFGKEYKGIGLRTDFAINYAMSKNSQMGVKFSYNIAPLKRAEEIDGESSSARTLLLSYMTLGFDLAYFF